MVSRLISPPVAEVQHLDPIKDEARREYEHHQNQTDPRYEETLANWHAAWDQFHAAQLKAQAANDRLTALRGQKPIEGTQVKDTEAPTTPEEKKPSQPAIETDQAPTALEPKKAPQPSTESVSDLPLA